MNKKTLAYTLLGTVLVFISTSGMTDSSEKNLESDLIKALQLNKDTIERVGDSGKAIQAYMSQGIVNKKPNQRSDYTDYYIVNKAEKFMGHDLVVIEEEYMTQNIGCCVNPGAGVSVRINDDSENLMKFAQENGCSLTEHVNLSETLNNVGISADFPEGDYASLSCRERDIKL